VLLLTSVNINLHSQNKKQNNNVSTFGQSYSPISDNTIGSNTSKIFTHVKSQDTSLRLTDGIHNKKTKLPDCNASSIWCSVKMPKQSLFRFEKPPIDEYRWRIAQIQASKGEQILLKKILEKFKFYLNFIDGDIFFRNLHHVVDIFTGLVGNIVLS
jgi:hypothetical protein